MSHIKFFRQALKNLQSVEQNFTPSQGHWFAVDDSNSQVYIYCDSFAEPILSLPYSKENYDLVFYLACIQNLSLFATQYICVLEEALIGPLSDDYKEKLQKELAEEI